MQNETIFILLFMVATGVAIVARRMRIPYTVGLVVAGILLGVLHAFQAPHLTKALLFSLFLPGLLFEAAFHIDFTDFWRNRVAIASLAVPGVVAAVVLITVILTPIAEGVDFVTGFDWRYGLVFGALIAATDPVAVVALFKTLGAPQRLTTLMEGESLLNDGTGIVFFTLSLSIVAGTRSSVSMLGLDFVRIVGMGMIFGTAVGLTVSQIIKQVDDPMIEITLTTIAAYGAFLAAEQFHYSGVIATVTAGMFCGNYGARTGMSPSTRIAVETFWDYASFALNSLIFLLIGFELHIETLLASWRIILIAYLAVTVGRAVVILGVSGLLSMSRERIPRTWSAVLFWGGLRGGLPMVLALSLSADFSHRDLLIFMTFGVVVISILLQGLTMSPLLRLLKIVEGRHERILYELTRGKLQTAQAALESLDHMPGSAFEERDVISTLRKEYANRVEAYGTRMREMHMEKQVLHQEEMQWARRHLLNAEKDEAIKAFHRGTLGQEAYERLLSDIDAALLRLDSGEDMD
jgi:CPA1 family monovalent cation:H+ antiporter